MAVGQHALRASKSISVQIRVRPQAGESISVQKWNSPHGGQVRYRDATAGHHMTAGSLQLFSYTLRNRLIITIINARQSINQSIKNTYYLYTYTMTCRLS